MENGLFSTAEFAKWSKDYVLFCHVTTRVEGTKYDNLLSQKKGNSFPYITVLDDEGNLLQAHRGPRELAAFNSTFHKAQSLNSRLKELDAKAKAGDAEAQRALIKERLERGFYSYKQAQEVVAKVKFEGEQKKTIEGLVTDIRIQEIIDNTNPRDAKSRIAGGGKLAVILAEGKGPASDATFENFWVLIMDHAESVSNRKNFKLGYDALFEKYGSSPRAERFFEGKRKILEGMK
ncbi:MAG: hypothetical protein AAF581_16655 [Planctomycetota bacterium]